MIGPLWSYARSLGLDVMHGTAVFVVATLIGGALLAAIMLPLWGIVCLNEWIGPDAAQSVVACVCFWVACVVFV